jgi:TPR repeat protein
MSNSVYSNDLSELERAGVWTLLFNLCNGVLSVDNKTLLGKRGVFKLAIDTLKTAHTCHVHASVCMALAGLVYKNTPNQLLLIRSDITNVLLVITGVVDSMLEDLDGNIIEDQRKQKGIRFLLETMAIIVSHMDEDLLVDIYSIEISNIQLETGIQLTNMQYSWILRNGYAFVRLNTDLSRWYNGILYTTMARLVVQIECCKPDHMKLSAWFHYRAVILDIMDSNEFLSLKVHDTYVKISRTDCETIGQIGVTAFRQVHQDKIIGCNGLKSIDKDVNLGQFYILLGKKLKGTKDSELYDTIILWMFNKSASFNDPEGIYYLALSYLKGYGTVPDKTLGLRLLNHAASFENADACLTLGSIHITMDNYEDAFKQLTRAVAFGSEGAFLSLANLYYLGLGVCIDYEYYTVLLKKAAQSETAATREEANLKLVYCYTTGIGVKINIMRACEFARLTTKSSELVYDIKVCGCCGMRGAGTKYCSGCFTICYCGSKCKRDHWKLHKMTCDFNK